MDRGDRRGRTIVIDLGREIRAARLEHGLSQKAVGRAVGLSDPEVSRIERGLLPLVTVLQLARLLGVVGLELSARAYPVGAAIRDRAQLALLERLRRFLGLSLGWTTEVPVGGLGDLRAWDAVISRDNIRVGVEAETRLTDVQAVERRIALKCRDSGIDVAILLLADTRTNRLAVRNFSTALASSFPLSGRDAMRELRAGRLPTASAVILA
ncbi:MAG: helix-turn-helix transcriptional regulator [Candidatus Limnocylindrales bacterium]